ncbi:hypothetical protein HI914_06543 [Erysiphe necator]|nr:hypothetical protein HI914_06543 [Erysiphe necator]
MTQKKKRWTPGYVINHFSKFTHLANEAAAVDNILWDGFREYFEDWDVTNFKLAGTTDLNNLRIFLRQRGVYVVRRKGFSVAQALHNVLLENEPSEWPEDELTNQMQKGHNTIVESAQNARQPQSLAQTFQAQHQNNNQTSNLPQNSSHAGNHPHIRNFPPSHHSNFPSRINNNHPHSHHRNSHPSHLNDNFRSDVPSSQQNLISQNVPQNGIHSNRAQDELTERQRTTCLINLHKIYRGNMKYSGLCDNLDCALDDFH